ncbi:hypothetical protein NP493_975g01000 [Ridgeia piscesae]|uniref:G-protein coupled receptors family 1 profile domain-containing protein n=1 Tax=Ridgeia piscesae TaxID=27915 RepID=A0AAD9NJ69_RIDPI|nr:hypothetical protein NP493_975g01000 [Ridgeia piscesae]
MCVVELTDSDLRQFVGSRCRRVLQDGGRSGQIERARIKTLKVTIVIVSVFVVCWTPYFVMSVWWWIDQESAKSIDAKIQRGLFIFAVSSSCVNPIVYGMCNRTLSEELRRCCLFGRKRNPFKRHFLAPKNIDNNRKLSGVTNGCVANGLLVTPCAVAVPSSPASWPNYRFRRQFTPPPIARDRRCAVVAMTTI